VHHAPPSRGFDRTRACRFARYARLEVAASKLKADRLASLYSQDEHFVFPAPDGGRDHRSVGRGIERAVERARLGAGISVHSFRQTYASQLVVGLGLDPVRVAKQLGHRNAGFTAATYAHMFEQARHANELRDRMSQGYGCLLNVNTMSTGARNQSQPQPAKISEVKLTPRESAVA
jgi:integrase